MFIIDFTFNFIKIWTFLGYYIFKFEKYEFITILKIDVKVNKTLSK